jgi:hypothetical protein
MDKAEVLPMIRRFIEKRGYKTSPYGYYITSNSALDEFLVYKDLIRLGIVTVSGNSVEFHPETSPIKDRKPYSFNLFDPNSLPSLIEQIKAHFIAIKMNDVKNTNMRG